MDDLRLELIDLAADYGARRVFTGVSLALQGGETLVVAGQNMHFGEWYYAGLTLAGLLFLSTLAAAADWPQWRDGEQPIRGWAHR